jgi:enoyl-CoA hydratase/carnithine racemase
MDLDVVEWVGTRVSMSLASATAVVQFFNPPHGYMDEAMEAELAQVLDRLEHWPQGRVVILTGRDPGVFIRHYDVTVLHKRAQFFQAKGKKFSLDRPVPNGGIHDCLERINKSPLIFIAAINGVAMGGGFELALGCDIRVVQEGEYQLGLPELNLGLLPGAGGTQAFAELLGTSRSLFYLLTAKVFNPQEVLALGIASACVEDVLHYAQNLAQGIEATPARACANIKQLVRNAGRWSKADGLAAERTLFCDCMADPQALPLIEAVALGQRTIADPLLPQLREGPA